MFISDDCKAVVGTINLDYRSLYHHFECAAYLYQCDCIPAIEADFLKTLSLCKQVTKETLRKEPITRKITGIVMKAIAPLM
jgi:cardiolipin synthase